MRIVLQLKYWYTLHSKDMKRIFIALKMASIAGQEKLSGIFRFLHDARQADAPHAHADWDITLVRTAAEFTPNRMREALAGNYDGFIVSIPDTEDTAAILAATDIPTIVMDIHDPALSARTANIVFIRNSPKEIGRAAADFLLSTGRCRSYAFAHSPVATAWSTGRFKSFKATLLDHGLWCHELAALKDLAKLERPIGIFAANDDRGYDVLEYCRRHRMRVPEDALVIGTDNDTLICENCRPALTSIQPDFEQEGFLAAKTLAELMAAASSVHARHISAVPPTCFVGVKTIVRRSSTAEVSQAGKLVQKAIAFIRKNALRGISVEDVVRHLGCSRRLADLRFRELQGASIGETIISFRLEEVKHLLKTTRDPIDKIAIDCGYGNPNYLKNLFKRRFGLTMRNFRKELT